MKRIFALITVLLLFCACTPQKNDKIKITASLFPQYDFLCQIAGDRAEITLLLPYGMESHNYEPSVKDIKAVRQSDLFVFTGENMEPWASGLIEETHALDLSKCVEECEEHHEGHRHEGADPHIWTSPVNAMKMVNAIVEELCRLDEKNAELYRINAEKYLEELQLLHEDFLELSQKAEGTVFCHGGKFSLTYLQHEYDLEFMAAYDSCSESAEPSARRMADMVEIINSNAKVVYYEELNTPRIAQALALETGSEMLLLHSCHNVSRDEAGETYLSLMRKNLENLERGIVC